MSVVEAVERDIELIRLRDPRLADSGMAAMAVNLAQRLEDPGASHTSASMNAHQLRDTLAKLWELAPPEKVRDELDELRERHAAGRGSASEGRARPGVRKVKGA